MYMMYMIYIVTCQTCGKFVLHHPYTTYTTASGTPLHSLPPPRKNVKISTFFQSNIWKKTRRARKMLDVPILGVETVLRLERNARVNDQTTEADNKGARPPTPRPPAPPPTPHRLSSDVIISDIKSAMLRPRSSSSPASGPTRPSAADRDAAALTTASLFLEPPKPHRLGDFGLKAEREGDDKWRWQEGGRVGGWIRVGAWVGWCVGSDADLN